VTWSTRGFRPASRTAGVRGIERAPEIRAPQNWNGLVRDTATLTETVTGDSMVEHLQDPGGPKIEIIWKRVR
jgi:hypothetical protein